MGQGLYSFPLCAFSQHQKCIREVLERVLGLGLVNEELMILWQNSGETESQRKWKPQEAGGLRTWSCGCRLLGNALSSLTPSLSLSLCKFMCHQENPVLLWMCTYVCVRQVCESVFGDQKRVSDSFYEPLHVGAWTELGSSGSIVSPLNCWDISPILTESIYLLEL